MALPHIHHDGDVISCEGHNWWLSLWKANHQGYCVAWGTREEGEHCAHVNIAHLAVLLFTDKYKRFNRA